MPAFIVPAALAVIAVLFLVFLWRLGREGRRRLEYWKGVLAVWRRNRARGELDDH